MKLFTVAPAVVIATECQTVCFVNIHQFVLKKQSY